MIVLLSFATLSALAIAGGLGLILCRQVRHCLLSFLLSTAALAGLYLLLSLPFIAAIQLVIHVGLAGLLLTFSLSGRQEQRRTSHVSLSLIAAVIWLALASWSILQGAVGEPLLVLSPVWAARDHYLLALGQGLVSGYLLPFGLAGLLLIVCVASLTHMRRREQDSTEGEDR